MRDLRLTHGGFYRLWFPKTPSDFKINKLGFAGGRRTQLLRGTTVFGDYFRVAPIIQACFIQRLG